MTELNEQVQQLVNEAVERGVAERLAEAGHSDPFIFGLTVFVLACFVGYYVVWRVTPALHTPLMSVTNAISGIIVVGAIIAVGPSEGDAFSRVLGFLAVAIASVNIFGGFYVTRRMLEMYRKKESRVESRESSNV